MKEILKVEQDEKGLMYLDYDDAYNDHEILGILMMMIHRVELEIIRTEASVSPMEIR